jgi:hypothetical protein
MRIKNVERGHDVIPSVSKEKKRKEKKRKSEGGQD